MSDDRHEDVLMDLPSLGSQLSFGTVMGISSGYALRQFGRAAGVAVGAGFCLVQSLSYLGYINVHWRKVERDYNLALDRDGDGRVTAKDLKIIFYDVADVLKFNLPAGTGFTTGLAYGISGNLRLASALGGAYGVGGAVLRGAAATGFPALAMAAKDEYESATGEQLPLLSKIEERNWLTSPRTTSPRKVEADSLPVGDPAEKLLLEKRMLQARRHFAMMLNGRTLEEMRDLEHRIKRNDPVFAEGLGHGVVMDCLRDEFLLVIDNAKKEEKVRRRFQSL